MAGVGGLIRSVWARISSAGAAGCSLSVERSSQVPMLLARAARELLHQGDEPYTAEPPPVAGTLCMLLLLSRSRGARLVHTCMSSAMRFPYELTENSVARLVLIFSQTWWYLCYPRQYAALYTCPCQVPHTLGLTCDLGYNWSSCWLALALFPGRRRNDLATSTSSNCIQM